MKQCMKCACKKKYFPQRYVLALLCILGVIVGYGQRICLSFAITEMTDKNASRSSACPERNHTFIKSSPHNTTGGILDWTNTEQHYVIGSFYIGYCIGHIPAGILCDHFGALAILLRIIMGLAQSVIFPAISVLYDKWVPTDKVWFWLAFAMAANAPGTVFGNLLPGAVIQVYGSWPRAFNVWGIIGVLWCPIYLAYVYSKPDTHRCMTDTEKDLLKDAVKVHPHMKYPWKDILTCLQFWAIVAAEIGHGFTLYTLANNLPKYIHNVLQYEMAENALASSIPFAMQWFGALISCKIIEFLISKKGIRIICCRKITTSIGLVVPPLFNVIAGFLRCDGIIVFVMFAIGMLFKGCCYAGLKVHHLDMSINFRGILMALINGIGGISGFISSFLISAMTPKNTIDEWMIIFWILFGIAICANIFYYIFCPAERQKWDYPPEEMNEYEKAREEKEKRKAAKNAK
ncbi:hypothetical protein Trydic_g3309 [Trypoxylus dichotomus]